MMRNGVKFAIVAVIAVGIVPVGMVALILTPYATTFISTQLGLDKATAIAAIIDYLALSYAVLLGVVVYRQTERINRLEATQYDLYLGIESIDYSCDLGQCFATKSGQRNGLITQAFGGKGRTYLLNVATGTEDGKTIFVPLSFVIKSRPLVVSICFQKATLEVVSQKHKIPEEVREIDENINAIFEDGSHFVFGLGLILPEQQNGDEIHFDVVMEVETQIKQKHKIHATATIIWIGDRFDLVSSYSTAEK